MVRNRGTNTLKHKHEEHENMQLSLKTTPSGLSIQGSRGISQASCGPYPIHGPARLASKMEGKCEKKMWVDFLVLENPSQRRNSFALESPLTFIFIFKWGKPSKNKKPQ